MVFQPCLATASPNPPTSQKIEAGNDDSDSTDDANGMPRLTEATRLIDTYP